MTIIMKPQLGYYTCHVFPPEHSLALWKFPLVCGYTEIGYSLGVKTVNIAPLFSQTLLLHGFFRVVLGSLLSVAMKLGNFTVNSFVLKF